MNDAKFICSGILTRVEDVRIFMDSNDTQHKVGRVMTVDSEGNILYAYVWDKTLTYIQDYMRIGDKVEATYLVQSEQHKTKDLFWTRLTMLFLKKI